jgi:hypothetical protein
MAFKTTTTTTTRSSARISGTKQISKTISKRKLSRSEASKGILTSLSQLGMIGITILTVVVGQTIYEFDIEDLTALTPNYTAVNEYISVEDPLNHFDYSDYADNALDNLISFVEPLSAFGNYARSLWTTIAQFLGGEETVQPGSFIDTFGEARFQYLSEVWQKTDDVIGKNVAVYLSLTAEEEDYLINDAVTADFVRAEILLFDTSKWYFYYFDSANLFEGTHLWFFDMPTVIQIAEANA